MNDADRIDRIGRMLRSQDLAAVFCGRASNVLACTGYWPVVGNSIAIVTREGGVGLLVPEDEAHLAEGLNIGKIRCFKPASLNDLAPITEVIREPLKRLIADLGCGTGNAGHDAGACTEPVTYAAQFHFGSTLTTILEDALSGRTLVDLANSLTEIRAVLTQSELELVREACLAAGIGFRTAKAQISAGMRERQIGLLLGASIAAASKDTRAGAFGFCMSGPNSAGAYRAYQMPTERAIQATDVALLHTNSFVNGIWTDITRTYSIGDTAPRVASVQAAIREATEAALAAIRPGVKGCEVDAAARSVMERAGFGREFKHATGHGAGLAAIDHNARPRIHPKSTDVLEPGMVFNVEPAAYFSGDFGARQCNMVAVTATGYELLTDFHLNRADLLIAQ